MGRSLPIQSRRRSCPVRPAADMGRIVKSTRWATSRLMQCSKHEGGPVPLRPPKRYAPFYEREGSQCDGGSSLRGSGARQRGRWWCGRSKRSARAASAFDTAESNRVRRAQLSALVQRLKELNWDDGRNVRLDIRWAAGDANAAHKFGRVHAGRYRYRFQPDGGCIAAVDQHGADRICGSDRYPWRNLGPERGRVTAVAGSRVI
jgi:hypothetical protein